MKLLLYSFSRYFNSLVILLKEMMHCLCFYLSSIELYNRNLTHSIFEYMIKRHKGNFII